MDETGRSLLSLRCQCVHATSMEFYLRPYHTFTTTMVRSCHVGEDRTLLLTGSVGAYHVHASSCVFVMSWDLSIILQSFCSEIGFFFNNNTVNTNSIQNS